MLKWQFLFGINVDKSAVQNKVGPALYRFRLSVMTLTSCLHRSVGLPYRTCWQPYKVKKSGSEWQTAFLCVCVSTPPTRFWPSGQRRKRPCLATPTIIQPTTNETSLTAQGLVWRIQTPKKRENHLKLKQEGMARCYFWNSQSRSNLPATLTFFLPPVFCTSP